MPLMRMNSLKSRAINCGPLSVMTRGRAWGYFSFARSRIVSTSDSFICSRISSARRNRNTSRPLPPNKKWENNMREQLTNYVRAGYAGLYVISFEEQRVEGRTQGRRAKAQIQSPCVERH